MRIKYFILTFLFLLIFLKFKAKDFSTGKKGVENVISFTENKGQVSDQHNKPQPNVLFSGTDGEMTYHIKNDGISYQLNRIDSYKEEIDPKTKEKLLEVDKATTYRVDAVWKNSNPNCVKQTGDALPGSTNYYLEVCPNGVNNVRRYLEVTLKDIYSGIDVRYYESKGKLKCDYIVAPGIDYKKIQIEISGAKIKLQSNGNVIFETPLGNIEEAAPISYQDGIKLNSRWVVTNNILSFDIDSVNNDQPLIIDPVTRVWGTYLGGTGIENGISTTSDALGNSYLTGYTESSGGTQIATVGAFQTIFWGSKDAFLQKFDASGVRQWGTYYGSNFSEYGRSCTVDVSGNIYMAGYSQLSGTVLATPGSHQPAYGGGNFDAFLAKFDATGARIWGTYYGGTNTDWGHCVTTDVSGNVYLAGTTTSTGTVMWTTNGWSSLSGLANGYVAKFNSAGVRQWSTCYGWAQEEGFSCAVDISGNVYLAGIATASTNIATTGAHQNFLNGTVDGYLVKFNSNCIRQWATYYGGVLNDFAYTVSTFSNTMVYIAGYTQSGGPGVATSGGHQTAFGGGAYDGFLGKFNSSGVRQWATLYGGSGEEYVTDCKTDNSGNPFVVGLTSTSTGTAMATNNSHQFNYGGGSNDAFVAKFSSNGLRQWGTYYGGSGNDQGNGCYVNATGALFLAGNSDSGSDISTSGTHQQTLGGTTDAFLTRFDVCVNNLTASPSSTAICSGDILTLTASGADTYTWSPGTYTASAITFVVPSTAFSYTLKGAALGCTATTSTFSFAVNPLPIITVNSGTTCMSTSFTLAPSGATSYTYSGGSAIVSPTTSTTYSVIGTDGNGCVSNSAAISTVTVIAPIISVNNGTICSGETFTINPSGAISYSVSGGSSVVTPTASTSYTVIGTDMNGCVNYVGAVSNITVGSIPIITATSGSICLGQSYTIIAGGADTYTFIPAGSIVTPTANISYTVTGTSTLGCQSNSFAVSNVTVNALPVISVNSGSVCSGQSFTIVPAGANTYTVSGGNNIVSPISTTTYSISGTNTLGCNSQSPAITTINVSPSPTLTLTTSNSSICAGESVTLTANGANTYTWNSGGTNNNEFISPTMTTTYSVAGTGLNGCISSMTLSQIVDPCVGIKEMNMGITSIKIYPNPNNGLFNIDIESDIKDNSVIIYNSLSQVIHFEKLNYQSSMIDLTEFSNGIYLIQIYRDNTIVMQIKIVKQ